MSPTPPARWTEGLDRLEDETLAEVNRLWTLAQVLSSTVHAVKNSLQITGGNAELIEARDGLDATLLKRVQTIRMQSMRAAAVLESLLAYARPAPAEAESIDVADLVRTALDMRAYALSRARITVEIRGAEGGPYITAIRRQALLQLVINVLLALESATAGRAGAQVIVDISRQETHVRVHVIGCGAQTAPQAGGPSAEFGQERLARVIDGMADALGVVLRRESTPEDGLSYALAVPSVGRGVRVATGSGD